MALSLCHILKDNIYTVKPLSLCHILKDNIYTVKPLSVCHILKDNIYTVKPLNRSTMEPTLSGRFWEVVIAWDRNKTIDLSRWLVREVLLY